MLLKIDEFQKEAAFTEKDKVMVIATPGAGKTTTLLTRVNHLIRNKKIQPKNIVVITFTKAAAQNMKNRFIRDNSDIRAPFFGTFHGLFYKILKNYGYDFDIIDSGKSYRVVKEALLEFIQDVNDDKIKEILNGISIFKKEGFNQDAVDIDISMEIFHHCFTKYEDYKKKYLLYDFDDLQLEVIKLFRDNERILRGYQNLFKHILVDEFQDCDRGQVEVLQMLNCENSVYAVGDEDQCIYGFRGSRPDYMVKFTETFEGGEKIYLKNNYRNPENLVESAGKLIKFNSLRNEKSINAVKDESGILEVNINGDEREQIDCITERVIKLNGLSGYQWEEIAILARTNMEITKVIDSFIRHRIPFRLLDKQYNFFDHFISKDIVSYLRLSIDPYNKEELARIINKPFRYISKTVVNKLKRANLNGVDAFQWLIDCKDIHPFQIKTIEDLRKDIALLNKYSLPVAIEKVLCEIGYNNYLMDHCDRTNQSMEDFSEIVDEFKELASESRNILGFLEHIEEFKEGLKENTKNDEGIILSTIHGVKGMEFKNVIIINCNEDILPYSKSIPAGIEEERRLFYVGVTRSSENLWVHACRYMRNRSVEPSRFIYEMELMREKKPEDYSVDDTVKHIVYGFGKVISIDSKEIEILFNDNSKRRFDVMVLIKNDMIQKIEVR